MFSTKRWSQLAGLTRLKESNEREAQLKASIEGFAVGQIDIHGDITIILYDPERMKSATKNLDSNVPPMSQISMMSAAIVGMIRISPPAYGPNRDENSCRGAWEVVRSGVRSRGTGVGGLLYKLAAAASPTGKLMPDRREVSPHAQNVWASKFNKMPAGKKELNVLDDENNAKTEDPSDDCIVHPYDEEKGPGSNFLNYAYDDFGGNVNIDALKAAHQNFMNEISWSLPDNVNINKVFYKAASIAFLEMTD